MTVVLLGQSLDMKATKLLASGLGLFLSLGFILPSVAKLDALGALSAASGLLAGVALLICSANLCVRIVTKTKLK